MFVCLSYSYSHHIKGINGTVSGAEDDVKALLAHLKSDPRLAGLAHKESWSETDTHARLKVRLKAEIVTLGVSTERQCKLRRFK